MGLLGQLRNYFGVQGGSGRSPWSLGKSLMGSRRLYLSSVRSLLGSGRSVMGSVRSLMGSGKSLMGFRRSLEAKISHLTAQGDYLGAQEGCLGRLPRDVTWGL